MKRLEAVFVCMVLGLMLAAPALAADYDMVILNGRVMDPETMYDDIANVGIKDGRIAAITKAKITGKQTIDAKGLVVAPGKFLTKDEYLQMVKEKPGYSVVVHLPPRQKWLKYWLTIPEMVVASDATPGADKDGKLLPWDADFTRYAGHPRTVSAYAMTLQLGRENGVPLMFTLSQLSYWSAKHLGEMGLEPIRFPVEAKGRFEPVTVNKWLSEYSINVPDMHGLDHSDSGAGKMVKGK